MRVAVIGVGHVGLVTAACMAELGHDVVGMDDDAGKVESLRGGKVPFYEPGLEDLVASGVAAGRLRFTGEAADAVSHGEVVFICVGTPRREDGAPNMAYVQAVASAVAAHATSTAVVAEKSTVPVRTGERIRHTLALAAQARGEDLGHEVVSNPEFLREGSAVADTLRPDRVVVGADSPRAHEVMRRLYAPLLDRHDCPYVATDVRTAELIKHASNAFLATKISFINAVARICELAGADVEVVADAMGHDARIGRPFLNAGLGFGGSCLVPEETVLARRDGVTSLVTVADLFQKATLCGVAGLEVLSWHPERQRPEFLPVSAVSARPYRGDIVEVRTKMGRRLRCTPDHPFMAGDGRSAASQVRLAQDLTEEDWLPLACGAVEEDRETFLTASPLAAVGAGAVEPGDVIHRLSPAVAVAEPEESAGVESWRLAGRSLAGDRSSDKRVPDKVWGASASHKRALLRGLWDGDGSWSLLNGGPSVALEYGTVSRRLADGILRLLGDLGLVARLKVGRTAKSTVDTYWLVLSGADQVEAALWLFPDAEAEEIRETIVRQSKRIAPTGYRRLRGSSTAWLRVVHTQKEPYDGWVYSLEVPDAHTVVTSGGLVTHNCFPKDVEAFIHIAAELGYDFGMLRETERVNREAKAWPLAQLRRLVWNLADKQVAVLGVAFKPGTDDVRDAPALEVIDALRAEGATVRLHDPVALDQVRGRWPDVVLCDKAEDALRGAHAVVVCTEWDEYAAITPDQLKELLEYPVVVDARNLWDPGALEAAGLAVASVGRPLKDLPTR